MKKYSLPVILQFLVSISIVLGSIATIGIIGNLLWSTFSNNPDTPSFISDMIWNITVELDSENYSLNSETLGRGVIGLAEAEVRFEAGAYRLSVSSAIQIITWVLSLGLPILGILINLYLVLGSVNKGNPFIPENIKRIRWIAGLLIFHSIAFQYGEAILTTSMLRSVQTEGLEIVNRVQFGSANMFVGLIIFALAEVFRYGLELQTEADLTV